MNLKYLKFIIVIKKMRIVIKKIYLDLILIIFLNRFFHMKNDFGHVICQKTELGG